MGQFRWVCGGEGKRENPQSVHKCGAMIGFGFWAITVRYHVFLTYFSASNEGQTRERNPERKKRKREIPQCINWDQHKAASTLVIKDSGETIGCML